MRLYELEQCWLRSQFSELLQCEHAVQLVQLEQLSQSLQPTQLLQFRLPPWPVWYVENAGFSSALEFP